MEIRICGQCGKKIDIDGTNKYYKSEEICFCGIECYQKYNKALKEKKKEEERKKIPLSPKENCRFCKFLIPKFDKETCECKGVCFHFKDEINNNECCGEYTPRTSKATKIPENIIIMTKRVKIANTLYKNTKCEKLVDYKLHPEKYKDTPCKSCKKYLECKENKDVWWENSKHFI